MMSRKQINQVQTTVEAHAAALPKYVVERINGVYEVYNTDLAVVEEVFPGDAAGKEAADNYVKNF